MDAAEAINHKSPGNRKSGPLALRPGEHILARAIISRGIFWKSIAVTILAVFMGLFVAPNLGIFFALVALVMFLFNAIIKELLMLVVTDQRVVIRYGTIKIDTVNLRLDRIESVELQRTIVGQVLGYSSVVITGTGTRLAFIPFVSNGDQVRNTLDEILYRREQPKQTDTPSAAPF